MPKLKTSEATKKKYWQRKKKESSMSNHDKRVADWEERRKRFPNSCGGRPMLPMDFNIEKWRFV